MCGGMENADRSKEVWPRTERILYFQVFPNLKMLHESNPRDKKNVSTKDNHKMHACTKTLKKLLCLFGGASPPENARVFTKHKQSNKLLVLGVVVALVVVRERQKGS
jgi:hypothetical protein